MTRQPTTTNTVTTRFSFYDQAAIDQRRGNEGGLCAHSQARRYNTSSDELGSWRSDPSPATSNWPSSHAALRQHSAVDHLP